MIVTHTRRAYGNAEQLIGVITVHAKWVVQAPVSYRAPQSLTLSGPDLKLGAALLLARADKVDAENEALLRRALTAAEGETMSAVKRLPACFGGDSAVIGTVTNAEAKAALESDAGGGVSTSRILCAHEVPDRGVYRNEPSRSKSCPSRRCN